MEEESNRISTTGIDGGGFASAMRGYIDGDVEEVKVDEELRRFTTGSIDDNDREVKVDAPKLAEKSLSRRLTKKFGNMTLHDHFTLSNPSSTVTFKEDQSIVLVENLSQIVLDKKGNQDYVTVSQTTVSSPGLLLIRFMCTLVASLMAGFLFVFCVQLIIFLFLGLTMNSGLGTNDEVNTFTFIGTLLSLPIVLRSLSQIMAIATTFIIDTWKGSKFMKTLTAWKSIKIHWLSFSIFMGVPVIVASISLCTGIPQWWAVTSITWLSLVFAYYIIFALTAIWHEIYGCLELIKRNRKLRNNEQPDLKEHNMKTFVRAIQLQMKQKLSGKEYITYISHGTDPHPDKLNYDELCQNDSCKVSIGPIARLSQTSVIKKMYKVLEKPLRQYDAGNVLESTPYFTVFSWGLESIYCRNRNDRFIAIIDGEGALSRAQTSSSVACFFLGTFLTLFLAVSILIWIHVSWHIHMNLTEAGTIGMIIFLVVIILIILYKRVRNSLQICEAYKKTFFGDDGNYHKINRNGSSDAFYQIHETFRITEPNARLCFVVFGLEVFLFFIIPLAALFSVRNYNVGILFIFLGVINLLRSAFNASACVRELGSLEGIEGNKDKSATSIWREKHRLGQIISDISDGEKSSIWIRVFLFFTITAGIVLFSALTTLAGMDDGEKELFKFARSSEFEYKGSNALNYASCSISHNIKSPEGNDKQSSLADFAFLSAVAYLEVEVANKSVDEWFGNTTVLNLATNVTEFKTSYVNNTDNTSPVNYRLLEFPDQNLTIVAIRGTANSWDSLADLQLWSSTALAQCVRAILPLGMLWTGILSRIVKAISMIENKALQDVSYYRETTAFVESLQSKGYNNIQIVGHSLGGGLAMITGAQTKIPAVALSGPNNMITRGTFLPEITTTDLDEYTFNIVPDRDPVPRIDDLAENYQRIKCRSTSNNPVLCHSAKRSLCEILFTCGSDGRPIPCFCKNDYEYEEPTSINGVIFSQECPEK